MLLQELARRRDDLRFVRRRRRVLQPDVEIVRALERRRRRIALAGARQILPRRFEIGFALVEGELGESDPCFRNARAVREIVDEFFEGGGRFGFALSGLLDAFLEQQLALHRLFRRIVADLSVIARKFLRPIEPQPGERGIKERFPAEVRRVLRDALENRRRFLQSPGAIIGGCDQPIRLPREIRSGV